MCTKQPRHVRMPRFLFLPFPFFRAVERALDSTQPPPDSGANVNANYAEELRKAMDDHKAEVTRAKAAEAIAAM